MFKKIGRIVVRLMCTMNGIIVTIFVLAHVIDFISKIMSETEIEAVYPLTLSWYQIAKIILIVHIPLLLIGIIYTFCRAVMEEDEPLSDLFMGISKIIRTMLYLNLNILFLIHLLEM